MRLLKIILCIILIPASVCYANLIISMKYSNTGPLEILIIGDSIAKGVSEPTNPLEQYVIRNYSYANQPVWANTGISGNQISDVEARFDTDAIALAPQVIFLHCGINDIVSSKTWANVESDMDSILSKCNTESIILAVSEVLPYGETDLKDSEIAAWNTSLASWCTANSVTLLETHDDMQESGNEPRPDPAKFRSDYLHPNTTGYQQMGDSMYASYQYIQ